MGIFVKGDMRRMIIHADKMQRRHIPAAAATGLNLAVRKTKTAAVREVANKTGIKQKIIRARIKARKVRLRDRHRRVLQASVTGALMKVRAAALGEPQKTKTGARVGRHRFEGAFVATSKRRGGSAIFRRKASTRLPLSEQGIEIRRVADTAIRRHLRTTGRQTFEKEFRRQMARRFKTGR